MGHMAHFLSHMAIFWSDNRYSPASSKSSSFIAALIHSGIYLVYRTSSSFSNASWASGCLFFSFPKIMAIA